MPAAVKADKAVTRAANFLPAADLSDGVAELPVRSGEVRGVIGRELRKN